MLFSKYVILFFVYSFIGWVMEIITTFMSTKKIINRGFLIGPYCPIYGTGVLMIFFIGGFINDFFYLFLISLVLCTLLEYFSSYFLELIFNIRWWDYSNEKYNIKGRICIRNLILFGIGGTIVLKFINPYLINIIDSLPINIINIVSLIIILFVLFDFIMSMYLIFKYKKLKNNFEYDSTEYITKFIKDEIKNLKIFNMFN